MPASAVAWSPDGRAVAAGMGNAVEFYDVETGRREAGRVENGAHVWGVAFLPDGRHVVTVGGAARVWRRGDGHRVRELHAPDGRDMWLALTPDGRALVTCGVGEKRLRFWPIDPL